VNTTPQGATLALVLLPLATACGRPSAEGTEGVATDTESTGNGEIDTSDETTDTDTPGCESVVFLDPALEQYVRDALGLPDGPIGGEDMLALTTIHVELGDFGDLVKLQSLSGLECATNLEELTWEDGLTGDFEGIEPLAGLSKLRILVLGGGPLVALEPLAGLDQLEVLSWRVLETPDLAPLAGLTNLRLLHLHDNQITDISPLAGLINLEELDLSSSPSTPAAIVDISPLAGLSNLRWLDIGINEIGDLSPLGGLGNLEVIILGANPVVDIGPLTNLPALHTVDARGTPIADVSPLADFDQVVEINLSGCQVSDLSGLVGATWQTPMDCGDIRITNNPLTDQTIAEDLPQICAANPSSAIWIGLGEQPFCNPAASCPG
jgi:hypothetical protein